jgi:predicted PurR-regulated permease PerM
MSEPTHPPESPTTQAVEIAIRLGLIFLILVICLQILSPFVSLLVWGAIIAIALYKPFLKLVKALSGRKKLAVVLIAVISIGAIAVPAVLLSLSMAESATRLGHDIAAGTVQVPPPSEAVKEWPVIGNQVYGFWQQASTNLHDLLAKYPDQLKGVAKGLLSGAAGVGLGMLQFIISLLIAAAFLSSSDALIKAAKRLALRLSPNDGLATLDMSVGTVRSVAVGVIGIAGLQALLGGLGMMAVGVPGAGLIALVLLVFGIAQLPLLIVMLPVCFYVFSVESNTTIAVIFMIWSVLVSLSDMPLKPLFLGRGVDAPMLVILLGAIGGMLTSGIVGLFIGAVVLAVGYRLFKAWVEKGHPELSSADIQDGQ